MCMHLWGLCVCACACVCVSVLLCVCISVCVCVFVHGPSLCITLDLSACFCALRSSLFLLLCATFEWVGLVFFRAAREFRIQRVRRRSTALARAPEEVKKDHEVVLAAIQRDAWRTQLPPLLPLNYLDPVQGSLLAFWAAHASVPWKR